MHSISSSAGSIVFIPCWIVIISLHLFFFCTLSFFTSYILPSFLPPFLDSLLPWFLSSLIPSFFPSLIPYFLHSFIHTFILPSLFPLLNSFLTYLFASFFPSFLHSFIPFALLPYFFPTPTFRHYFPISFLPLILSLLPSFNIHPPSFLFSYLSYVIKWKTQQEHTIIIYRIYHGFLVFLFCQRERAYMYISETRMVVYVVFMSVCECMYLYVYVDQQHQQYCAF